MSRTLSPRDREKLVAEIAALEPLSIDQLKARWRTLYETEPPLRFSHDLLLGAVAYRMQERALGGLRPATRRLFSASRPTLTLADRSSSRLCASSNPGRY